MYEQEIGDLCSSLLSQQSSLKGERREGPNTIYRIALLYYYYTITIVTRPHTHTP